MPWTEPMASLLSTATGGFALPTLVSSTFLDNCATLMLSHFGIQKAFVHLIGKSCTTLDVAQAFTIAHLLPEIVNAPKYLFPGANDFGECICYCVEPRTEACKEVAPLQKRFSVQQMRELIPLALQRICLNHPNPMYREVFSNTFLYYNNAQMTFGAMNLNGLALVQTITANFHTLMNRETNRLVFFVAKRDQIDLRVLSASMLENVTRMGLIHGNDTFKSNNVNTQRINLCKIQCLVLAMKSVISQATSEEICCVDLPLPDIVTTKKNGTSEFDIDIDTEKMCVNLSSAISFVADQSKYVSFHRVLCNVPAGECPAVQCQHSLHLHNIMHTLRSIDSEQQTEKLKNIIETGLGRRLQELVDSKVEQIDAKQSTRESLPEGMGIGLYLHLLSNTLLDTAKHIENATGTLSARFSEAEEDRKLWEFLGNAVLRFAADVHPLHGDESAMSADNKASENVCLVEYNVERVAHLLPSYVKHVEDFISGDKYAVAIPLLFHAPLGVVGIPGHANVVKEAKKIQNIADRLVYIADVVYGLVGIRVCNHNLSTFLRELGREVATW